MQLSGMQSDTRLFRFSGQWLHGGRTDECPRFPITCGVHANLKGLPVKLLRCGRRDDACGATDKLHLLRMPPEDGQVLGTLHDQRLGNASINHIAERIETGVMV